MRFPQIVILSSVFSFIEEEVSKVDYNLETGGLLLGTKLPNGRLITHATPPGPNAQHHPSMFERDLEFSQAVLNHFASQTGVDYVGEWHKHPPYLTQPSKADRQGVIEILRDPDYKTGDMIIFPIWIQTYDVRLRRVPFHHVLVEYFCRLNRANVRCFPYYMDNELEFRPFQFHTANCDLDTQTKVKEFYMRYLKTKGIVQKEKIQTTKKVQRGATEEKQKIGNQNDHPSGKNIEHEHQWYETQEGKNRLVEERKLFISTNCYVGSRMLPKGRLACRFASPSYEDVFLDLVCKSNHPSSFPEIFLWHSGKYISVLSEQGLEGNLNIPSHVLEKIEELHAKWEKRGSSMMITNIANALGFSRIEQAES